MSETRETVNADMHQVIPGLTGDIASGRAEDSGSCSQKCCTMCNIFVNKKKRTMLPQANRVFIGSNARFECLPRNLCKL